MVLLYWIAFHCIVFLLFCPLPLGEAVVRVADSDDQQCPKARRLVATRREIKALGIVRYSMPANPRPACH